MSKETEKRIVILTYEDKKDILKQEKLQINANADFKDFFYKLVYILPNIPKNFVWEIYADDKFIGFIEKNGFDNPKIKVCVMEEKFSKIYCKKNKQP